jgi:toxin
MEQVIRPIGAFAGDVVLQGKTYDSAKVFFVQTYRQLAQGIIYLCEELIRQNNALRVTTLRYVYEMPFIFRNSQ